MTGTSFELYEYASLRSDIREKGLRAGDEGLIINKHTYPVRRYELEFLDLDGAGFSRNETYVLVDEENLKRIPTNKEDGCGHGTALLQGALREPVSPAPAPAPAPASETVSRPAG